MALGITIEQVVNSKMSSYFESIKDENKRNKIRNEYIQTAKSSIQGSINEAESLVNSIESTIAEVTKSVPITIAQIASLTTMVDPTAKAAQLTTIATSVGDTKDTVTRATSQLEQLKNILVQLGITSTLVNSLSKALSEASALLNTIPI